MRPRHLILTLGLAACSASSPGPAPLPAPVAPVVIAMPTADEVAARELNADEQVKQAINRLTYGPRPGEYDSVRALGVDRWVARQLDPKRIPDPDADRYLAHFSTLIQSGEQLLAAYPPASAQKKQAGASMTAKDSAAIKQSLAHSRRLLTDLQAAKVGRAVISERQLDEVMTDFWFNHFNVYAAKGHERYYLPQYELDAIRPYVLGSFRALLGAVAHSPAMLFYLDNWESRANPNEPVLVAQQTDAGGAPLPPPPHARNPNGVGPRTGGSRPPPGALPGHAPNAEHRPPAGLNENYARELLELHTLGVDGGYTQEDVINVARVFTGWTIEKPQQLGTFVFRPQWHDAGSKTVLGTYFPAGHGIDEGERVLDLLASDPHTATHIATQLAIRFVSDSPPPALVRRAAAAFTRSGGDIRETVRVIVQSPEFFSTAAYKSKVKSPLRVVVSALRAVDAAPDTSPRSAQIVARLGEPLYLHQAPNGYPLTGSSWINTGAILNRINFGLAVAAERVPGATLSGWPQGLALSREPHDLQVDGVIALLLQGEASPDTRRILENGVNPMLAQAPADSQNGPQADSLAALAEVEASLMGLGDAPPRHPPADSIADDAAPMPPPPRASAAGGGLKKTGIARGYDPLAAPTDLSGFARMVGLALGAPEFQRH